MTSEAISKGVEGSVAKYRGVVAPKDAEAQSAGDSTAQWILVKDVDHALGYQTPPPPQHPPVYEGQVVLVPAELASNQT